MFTNDEQFPQLDLKPHSPGHCCMLPFNRQFAAWLEEIRDRIGNERVGITNAGFPVHRDRVEILDELDRKIKQAKNNSHKR